MKAFLLVVVLVAGLAGNGLAQAPETEVTSDTPEYCGVLMNRISGMVRQAPTPPPSEAAALSEAGERMCVQGQYRGGIMRLRRALMILRHIDD